MTDPDRTIKIAYVTDRGFLEPTLVSAWSLLQHLNGPAELHFWGDRLEDSDWANVRRIASGNPQVTLHCLDISSGYLEGAYGPQGYISAATMGRLYIPGRIDGYVLYIDGDTLVTGDVAPLFGLDLKGAYAGVVRDYTVAHWLADRAGHTGERRDRLAEIGRMMDPAPAGDYFNAGIMLLNCDALRAEPAVMERMMDVAAASARSHGDQDHLNALFRGNVVHLDLGWNASWGRLRKHRDHLARNGTPTGGAMPAGNRIIHYHGPEKPWRQSGLDFWSSRGRATRTYRRALRRFLRLYPDIRPA